MDIKASSEKRFALLIDADNVSARYIKPITDELSKYGSVTYKRIYGDWTLTLHAKWKDVLLENSISPIQQFGYTQGKNATDSAMIIDAMDILYTRSVEGFCIVSSDSDFTRLASRIRESGLTVIGMGEKKTPTAFRKACDIFTTLELLVGDNGNKSGRGKDQKDHTSLTASQNSGPSIEEIERAVVTIITDNQNNGKSTGVGEVGSRLLKRYPDFDVRSYKTNQLTKLLGEFSSVQIIKEGSSMTVELTESREAHKSCEKSSDKLKNRKEKKNPSEKKSSHVPTVPLDGSCAGESPSAVVPHSAGGNSEVGLQGEERTSASDHVSKPTRRGHRGAIRRTRVVSDQAAIDGSGVTEDQKSSTTVFPTEPVAQISSVSETPALHQDSSVSSHLKDISEQQTTSGTPHAPDRFIRQMVLQSGREGISLAALSKSVRAKYRDFKVRDLGYSQFRTYLADLDDIEMEKSGRDYLVRLAE